MARTFAYCRVSTADQTTDNQVREIEAAGFAIDAKRIVSETVSGSVAAVERKGFAKLLDRLESDDVLVVTKLDRLGRNAMDVRATVERLDGEGVRVHCLALGGVDLTSAAGKMTMGVIAAVAEFERDLLIERTQSGLSRAKAAGKALGRPQALSSDSQRLIVRRRKEGASLGLLAKEFWCIARRYTARGKADFLWLLNRDQLRVPRRANKDTVSLLHPLPIVANGSAAC